MVCCPTPPVCCERACPIRCAANPFGTRERQPYLVALQSDLLSRNLDTVVVAPLERLLADTFADRLNPQVKIGDELFVLIAQELEIGRAHV